MFYNLLFTNMRCNVAKFFVHSHPDAFISNNLPKQMKTNALNKYFPHGTLCFASASKKEPCKPHAFCLAIISYLPLFCFLSGFLFRIYYFKLLLLLSPLFFLLSPFIFLLSFLCPLSLFLSFFLSFFLCFSFSFFLFFISLFSFILSVFHSFILSFVHSLFLSFFLSVCLSVFLSFFSVSCFFLFPLLFLFSFACAVSLPQDLRLAFWKYCACHETCT